MRRFRDTCIVGALVAMLFSVSYWIDVGWPPPEETPRVGAELAPAAGC